MGNTFCLISLKWDITIRIQFSGLTCGQGFGGIPPPKIWVSTPSPCNAGIRENGAQPDYCGKNCKPCRIAWPPKQPPDFLCSAHPHTSNFWSRLFRKWITYFYPMVKIFTFIILFGQRASFSRFKVFYSLVYLLSLAQTIA